MGGAFTFVVVFLTPVPMAALLPGFALSGWLGLDGGPPEAGVINGLAMNAVILGLVFTAALLIVAKLTERRG